MFKVSHNRPKMFAQLVGLFGWLEVFENTLNGAFQAHELVQVIEPVADGSRVVFEPVVRSEGKGGGRPVPLAPSACGTVVDFGARSNNCRRGGRLPRHSHRAWELGSRGPGPRRSFRV